MPKIFRNQNYRVDLFLEFPSGGVCLCFIYRVCVLCAAKNVSFSRVFVLNATKNATFSMDFVLNATKTCYIFPGFLCSMQLNMLQFPGFLREQQQLGQTDLPRRGPSPQLTSLS